MYYNGSYSTSFAGNLPTRVLSQKICLDKRAKYLKRTFNYYSVLNHAVETCHRIELAPDRSRVRSRNGRPYQIELECTNYMELQILNFLLQRFSPSILWSSRGKAARLQAEAKSRPHATLAGVLSSAKSVVLRGCFGLTFFV